MNILICSDGHQQSEAAARFLASSPAAPGARATLLGIIEDPSDEASLEESLGRIAELLRSKGITVEIVTRSGMPIEEIRKQAGEKRYDLAVIGAEHKRGGPFALSSKAYHVIKEVDLPVLVVIGRRTALKKTLICSAGRGYGRRQLGLTCEVACKGGVEVTLLHILAEPPVVYSDLLEAEGDVEKLLASNSSLACNLRKELEAFSAMGVQPRLKLRHGLVGTEIVRETEEGGYDLVIAGSVPSDAVLRTYLLGDVTSEIVNSVHCPVLVVRADSRPAEAGWWKRLRNLFQQRMMSRR